MNNVDKSAGTLYTFPEYPRTFPSLICSAYGKADLSVCDISSTGSKDAKSNGSVLSGEVPYFKSSDGSCDLHDSTAIAYYLANEQMKGGRDVKRQCEVLQWTHWAERKFMPLSEACSFTEMGIKSKDEGAAKKITADARKGVTEILKELNEYLKTRTFFVGERISLADLVIFSGCFNLFKYVVDEPKRKELPYLMRWFNTILHQPEVQQSLGKRASGYKFCEKEARPAEGKANAGKAQKPSSDHVPDGVGKEKPKKKEAATKSDEQLNLDEDEAAEQMPKSKNPLARLPKGTFSIDDFKRVYCNQETETVAIPYFWEKFDPEHYSIWLAEYRYPKELKMTFMTSNLISGMFQRLDSLRNYAFASICIFGEDNNNAIGGLWVWRGQQLVFQLCDDWSTDYESYTWEKLDPSKPETRKLVNGYLMWEPEDLHGKKFKEGKIFK